MCGQMDGLMAKWTIRWWVLCCVGNMNGKSNDEWMNA